MSSGCGSFRVGKGGVEKFRWGRGQELLSGVKVTMKMIRNEGNWIFGIRWMFKGVEIPIMIDPQDERQVPVASWIASTAASEKTPEAVAIRRGRDVSGPLPMPHWTGHPHYLSPQLHEA
ncbi:hypothetical protein CEXT_608891 [Caerostris extrusa]|uniref:Uncharacterized protein n=1 Tax=Caerostris extrusa TaxID=172846 RepID=A0AAV4XFP2_CAEEX|nr:hypothetical protein CEXT_608891 [Caerostris extrusa]